MLKKILGIVAALIAILLAVIASRPEAFRIERKTTINAPADIVFAQINDFHKWAAWSPWEKLDTSMKKTYSGPESGKDAKYEWVGNDKVGSGAMTITDSAAPKTVGIKLEFKTPWEATNQTTFTVSPAGAGSEVSWVMEGKNNFGAKAFGLFMNMDQLVGADFEKGLAEMKTVAEAEAAKVAEVEKLRAEADKKAAEEAAAAAAAAQQATDAGK